MSMNSKTSSIAAEITQFRFYILLDTNRSLGHFRDVLPSQSLGLVLKKLNLTTKANQP